MSTRLLAHKSRCQIAKMVKTAMPLGFGRFGNLAAAHIVPFKLDVDAKGAAAQLSMHISPRLQSGLPQIKALSVKIKMFING